MDTSTISKNIKQLAHYLDTDQFEKAKDLLAPECVYFSSGGKLVGPDEIIKSYKEHTEYAHTTFDKVIYESSIQQLNTIEFSVFYKDIISKNEKNHTYTCKQIITFNSENLISTITHEEISGEYEKLKEFYREVGI